MWLDRPQILRGSYFATPYELKALWHEPHHLSLLTGMGRRRAGESARGGHSARTGMPGWALQLQIPHADPTWCPEERANSFRLKTKKASGRMRTAMTRGGTSASAVRILSKKRHYPVE